MHAVAEHVPPLLQVVVCYGNYSFFIWQKIVADAMDFSTWRVKKFLPTGPLDNKILSSLFFMWTSVKKTV